MEIDSVRLKMEKALEVVAQEVGKIHTGRATSSLVEDIVCSVYGGSQKLKVVELATINVPEPQQILITPFDPSIIGEIRNSLLTSSIGLNPSLAGDVIRISVPPLSSERREQLVKLLGRLLENGRVMVRQIRRDKMVEIKKAFEEKTLSEDEQFDLEKKLQKITDEFVGKIDEMGQEKEAELLKV